MDSTILKISNATNTFMDDYQIGNILNKNLLIRNFALMRNIGKYSMYNQPMYPEVGMAYNVYEHLLNRPTDIGIVNGLIGYNNGIVKDDNLIAGGGEKLEKRFREIPLDDSDDIKKTVYVTNSDSIIRSGGKARLGETMAKLYTHLANDKYIKDDSVLPGLSINNPHLSNVELTSYQYEDRPEGVVNIPQEKRNPKTYTLDNFGEETLYQYQEGNSVSLNGTWRTSAATPHTSVDTIRDFTDYEAKTNGWLIHKTNQLFQRGKIRSVIRRFYAKDTDLDANGDPIYLSRGRNLFKEGKTNGGGGYDNPYCRVWTVENQYSKMTDLIRPRLDSENNFATIEEIQGDYGNGLRPFGGAKRLSDMSVLKSNGFVNIAPHKENTGEIDLNSIKKCMFSIENLAWKDIQREESITRKYYYKGRKNELEYDSEYGGTLTKEQIGPNGGRIMWFPPYNLKFSEDVSTEWNSNTFIGRGEKIYTYVNTERAGSLSFTLLIDHPSIINKWRGNNPETSGEEGYTNEQKILRFFAGCDDLGEDIASQKQADEGNTTPQEDIDDKTPKEAPELQLIKCFVFFPNNYSAYDDYPTDFANYLKTGGKFANTGYEVSNQGQTINNPIEGVGQTWYYRVDSLLASEKLRYYATKSGGNWDKYYKRTKNGPVEIITGERYANNGDNTGFTLNAFNQTQGVDTLTPVLPTFKKIGLVSDTDTVNKTFFSFTHLFNALNGIESEGSVDFNKNQLYLLLNSVENFENIDHIVLYGNASSHGHVQNNKALAKRRANAVLNWIKKVKPELKNKLGLADSKVVNLTKGNMDVSSLEAKAARSVVVEFYVNVNKKAETKAKEAAAPKQVDNRLYSEKTVKDDNIVTYDDEYTYFKELEATDSFIKNRIVEKIQYFDPAYHSVTPEGFNARLTFLQQCTRQGPTASASDPYGIGKNTGVGNLAFGRAPYCVLRIGDFYNIKILIENVSIQYDVNNGGVQWDMNPEGVGVQPMMADVNIRFKFIGGTDLSGPIERLQNAVSFNYYSNASVYDRRADYREGFIDNSEGIDKSTANPVYFYDPTTQVNKKK